MSAAKTETVILYAVTIAAPKNKMLMSCNLSIRSLLMDQIVPILLFVIIMPMNSVKNFVLCKACGVP